MTNDNAQKTPLRIWRRRMKGWRKPPNTVNCARGRSVGKYGNPFKVGEDVPGMPGVAMDARDAVDYFTIFQLPKLNLTALRGRNCMCYCPLCDDHRDGKPLGVECDKCAPCHVDVILEAANK